ncbi:MAG TPA: 5-deoxy-glucuronate isomerase, partial [Vicinamibacterales bacterium]|nr:5-deoxy-glucuronate isomerase [Vicinamibacterales bacterium]
MLKDTLFRVPRATGLHLLHRRGDRDARELTSWRLRLDAGGVERYTAAGEETVVVLQEGRGTFECDGEKWPVSRAGVFTERATALLLPSGRTLTVRADTPLEAILISAPAPDGGSPYKAVPPCCPRRR